MKTDLDRLHKVAMKDRLDRGEGKTFYQCHLVAGAAEVGHKRVIVLLPRWNWAEHIMPMLEIVLQDHKLKILHKLNRRHWLLWNGTEIIFETGNKKGYGKKESEAVVPFD